MPTEDQNGDSTLNKVNDANYYPPETKLNPTQVEVEQDRAIAMNDHLDAIKSQERR